MVIKSFFACKAALLLALAASLSGCETIEVLSMPEEKGTASIGEVKLSVMMADRNETSNRAEALEKISHLPGSVQDTCYPSLKEEDEANLLGSFTIPLIMSGAQLGYSAVSDALKGAALKKLGRFQES